MELNLELSKKQMELLQSENEINVISAGRGSGKTAITSILALIHLLQGRNVMVIAPSVRQLKDQNFKEILKFMYQFGLAGIVNSRELRIKYRQKEIIFISGETAETIRGYSEIATLIFDETANLDHDCYKLAIACMRNLKFQKKKIYIVGTPPASEQHWLVQLIQRPDVNVIYASAQDNPFVEPDFLLALEKEYEFLPDDFRKRELYGEFVFSTDNNRSIFHDFVIESKKLDYIDQPMIAGLDIAGRGGDMTCMVLRRGPHIIEVIPGYTPNDRALLEFVHTQWASHKFDVLRYDATGFGHLITFDMDPSVEVIPVTFSASGGERFANMRTLMYSRLANMKYITMDPVAYHQHGGQLLRELKATQYKLDDNRKLCLIKKEEIAEKIGGRSPDRADATALAFSHVELGPQLKPRVPASALRGIDSNKDFVFKP